MIIYSEFEKKNSVQQWVAVTLQQHTIFGLLWIMDTNLLVRM
ncbi:hypothetical protein [Paenibacillus macquariensis]|uniref:Uncharacterized protein n=1 Tax=Paenibacillus macquariensis TaxID=948756 RepID=A0ABY1KBH9_9BACL|nr:hypothetical protein [Paenibacillus macquariensis]MEC0094294.1 hypothetical protein [Paenibacillus macquariensis]SIR55791.1 hypothetical protein SAMN05421578_118100 [Paenibacillus macquariensis]